MTKRVFSIAVALACSIQALPAEFNELYSSSADFFSLFQDPNTGLSVFPTLTIPMGGEREALGTAYTAVARDASFLEANPAASSMLEQTELALFHNNWIADTNIESLVFTRREERFGYALGGKFLYVPFTGYDIWGGRTAAGYYSETILAVNASYNFMRDYYFDGVSLGGTLKLAYRHVPDTIAGGQSALGVMADVGVLTRFNFLKFHYARARNFSVGIALKNAGPLVLEEPLPTLISAGIAYSPIRPLLFSADFNLPVSLAPDDFPAERPGFALGTAVNLTTFLTMNAGFLMKGGNPRITIGSRIGFERFTFFVNYTLDMTTQITNLDRFSVQLRLNLGDEGRRERELKTESIYLEGIKAFADGDFHEAAARFREVLRRDPTYLPAKETLEIVERSLELQQQMRTTLTPQ